MPRESTAIKVAKMEVKIGNLNSSMRSMGKDIKDIKSFLFDTDDGLSKLLGENYVRKDDYKVVKTIVFGAASIILTSVFGALVYLVVGR